MMLQGYGLEYPQDNRAQEALHFENSAFNLTGKDTLFQNRGQEFGSQGEGPGEPTQAPVY